MIELPEAAVLAKQINRTLIGRQIVQAVAGQSPHRFAWYTGDPATYDRRLAGKIICGASAFGNHIEMQAGERAIVISTPIRYHPAGEKPPARHQLLLVLDDGAHVSCTVQMWGALACFRQGEESGIPDYPAARKKPSPLSGAFDRAYFDGLFDEDTRQLSAKAFLATQQRIPGLGNGVLQDVLWTARIHPRRRMADLTRRDLTQMFRAVKAVLQKMIELGGRDTERDLFGCAGRYPTVLSKNTVGQPCRACGTVIRKQAYLGGSIYVCEGCQKL